MDGLDAKNHGWKYPSEEKSRMGLCCDWEKGVGFKEVSARGDVVHFFDCVI